VWRIKCGTTGRRCLVVAVCYVKLFRHVNKICVGNGVEHFHITLLRVFKGKRFWAHSQNGQKRPLASWLYVCLSVRVEQLGSHWTDFYEIVCFSVFRKSDNKIQVSLKSAQMTGISHECAFTFVIISCWFLLGMSNISDKTCREKSKHIIFKLYGKIH
jgi:hypothetical protein